MIIFRKTTGKTFSRSASAIWILEVFYLLLPWQEICTERTRSSMPCVCQHDFLWLFFSNPKAFPFVMSSRIWDLLKKRPPGGSSTQQALFWCAWQVQTRGNPSQQATFQSQVWGHHHKGKRTRELPGKRGTREEAYIARRCCRQLSHGSQKGSSDLGS